MSAQVLVFQFGNTKCEFDAEIGMSGLVYEIWKAIPQAEKIKLLGDEIRRLAKEPDTFHVEIAKEVLSSTPIEPLLCAIETAIKPAFLNIDMRPSIKRNLQYVVEALVYDIIN